MEEYEPAFPKPRKRKKGTSRIVNKALVKKYDDKHPDCELPNCDELRWLGSHHIIFKSQLGPDTEENLIALCKKHHLVAHGIASRTIRKDLQELKKCYNSI